MVTKIKVKAEGKIEPKFRNPSTMSEAELTDPDYRIKALAIEQGLKPDAITNCSKCHHCR